MFSRIIKDFFLKRKIKKRLEKYQLNYSSGVIKSVGILIDETYFNEADAIVNQLEQNGFDKDNIEILFYLDKKKKYLDSNKRYFFKNAISWNGSFKNEIVVDFIQKPFDLLISYYDIEKPVLLKVSKLSKANFKVGFHTIDKRINHFMVNLPAENYNAFISELIKYLKILKKI